MKTEHRTPNVNGRNRAMVTDCLKFACPARKVFDLRIEWRQSPSRSAKASRLREIYEHARGMEIVRDGSLNCGDKIVCA